MTTIPQPTEDPLMARPPMCDNEERQKGGVCAFLACWALGGRALAAVCLAVALALPGSFLSPHTALADVRKADVVMDSTVETRGLTVAECPSIESEYAALMDKEGTVYFSRNGDQAQQIASITKVMTAIVALEHAQRDQDITVSADAATIGESSANLQEGDVMDFDAAMKALLVPSGNDAAVALAESVGQHLIDQGLSQQTDPVRAFVEKMNDKAHQLGCQNTVYENPHGLDDGSYVGNLHSTALDQVKVAQCAMGYDEIRSIVSHGSTSIEVEREGEKATVELETTDELLEMYDYAIGVKTGMTDAAGPSFMGAAEKEGRELYVVVLDSEDEHQRFVDARTLFEWYYDHVKVLSLAQSDQQVAMEDEGGVHDVPLIAEVSHGDWMDRTVKATLADPDAQITVFDLEGNVSQSVVFDELRGTVNAGDKVGTVTYRQHNLVVAEQDLVAAERVEGPNPLEALAIMGQRFIGGFSGQPSQADSRVYNVMPVIDDNKTSGA